MNPADDASLIYELVKSINTIIGEVFPKCGIAIEPSLQDILEILKPKYDIKVFSNIRTGAARQGTGLIWSDI
jgi:putative ATP-dependent endonuclease of the OLD family